MRGSAKLASNGWRYAKVWIAGLTAVPAALHPLSPARFPGCHKASRQVCLAFNSPRIFVVRSSAHQSALPSVTTSNLAGKCAVKTGLMPSFGLPVLNRKQHQKSMLKDHEFCRYRFCI